MYRSARFFVRLACLSLGFAALAGCASGQFPTLTIYDAPQAYVRLQADRSVWQHAEYSHPANISTERMRAVLQGIVVQEPLFRLPLYDDLSIPRRHKAFDESAITFLAPLLSLALQKATTEEMVTFYQSRRLSGVAREVTSGGMFIEGDTLHFILANYRSNTQSTADISTASTLDDRLTPLQPLAPQQVQLGFEPRTALQPPASSLWTNIMQTDRRELIIQFRQLTLPSLNETPRQSLPSDDISR